MRRLTPDEIQRYRDDGFLIVREFFSADEIAPLAEATASDPTFGGALGAVADSSGNAQNLVTWVEPSSDYIGMVPFLDRMVTAAEDLIGREVYHWHSKFVPKPPHTQGRWDWHQDYGYWYYEGCLLPDMITATFSVDGMSRENGAMQVLRGSHRMGRIDVKKIGKASGTDPERLALAMERYELVYVELAPGDTVFFDSLTLHCSGPNDSDRPRTLLHASYNARDNVPFNGGPANHPYRPIVRVPDDALRARRWTSIFSQHRFIPRKPGDDVHKDSPVGFTVVEPVTAGGGTEARH